MIVLKTVYQCDPKKNTKCPKTHCYTRGGECKATFDPQYSTGWILEEDVRVHQEDERKRKRCEYCGCLSKKEYGTCEHCGAPL